MGRRGPAPEPTKLKLVKGVRASRINLNEPKPPLLKASPDPPGWMLPEAREIWDLRGPELFDAGVLTKWDVEAFAVYCEAVVHHREACKLVDQSSVLVKTPNGLVKNPALQVIRDQAAIIRAFAQEFGLTPSGRSRINAEERPADGDDLFD